MIDHGQEGPISLYLHFPFCERKCRYCDFLSGPASEETREEYIRLLCREITLRGRIAGGGTRCSVAGATSVVNNIAACGIADREPLDSSPFKVQLDTIFIGGGTPSLMKPAQLESVMKAVRDSYEILPDAEISMEVNPGTADLTKLRAYRKAGVNRLSIGVQSLDDRELKLLGRIHTADQAREIFRAAREAGFDNINLDLMSALPGQTMESWSRTLRAAVELAPEHISAYSLIIEDGTPFAAMYDAGQLSDLPSEEEDREIYHFTGEFLAGNGYRRYEISNYTKEGFACRHNCGYWTGHEYLGLGLGASSDFRGERFRNPDEMEEYRRAVTEASLHDTDDALRRERQQMTPEDRMEEFMFLGLRMTCGVSEREFKRRFGRPLAEVFGEVIKKQLQQDVIRRYAVPGHGTSAGGDNSEEVFGDDYRVALTEYGLDVANHVMAEYLF